MPEDYPLLYALDGVSGSMGWYAENAKAKAKAKSDVRRRAS
jgi:hypothetical protein